MPSVYKTIGTRFAFYVVYADTFSASVCFDLLSFVKMNLNIVLTVGWIKKSCEKNAKGKLKHISFSHSARRVQKLKPVA